MQKCLKRLAALLLAALFFLTTGSALAAGNTIGNKIEDESTLYPELVNGRKILRKAFLSDRYATTDGEIRVFHNLWDKGSWNGEGIVCRSSGTMALDGESFTKGIGMYLERDSFRSSAEGTEASGVVQYTLNGIYDEFYFGIGPDSSDSRYCGSDDGTARVQIYLDDVIAYDTDFFGYDSAGYNQAIVVKGANKLKIVLTERRGRGLTLNVLLTNPLLVDY